MTGHGLTSGGVCAEDDGPRNESDTSPSSFSRRMPRRPFGPLRFGMPHNT